MINTLSGKRLGAITLGCKVNMYDTEAMVEILKDRGCVLVDFNETADIYIVNTCTVTNLGDKKSRQAIRKAVKKNPDALIVACGCYSQVAPEAVSGIEGVDLIIGTADRARIAEFILSHLNGEKAESFVSPLKAVSEFEDLKLTSMNEKTRAYLKIQEGCDRYCSYCIIPYARGPVRSRPKKSVLEEAANLAANGYKEIVLTGIHVASYGNDIEGTCLADIITEVHKIEGIQRIRLSSVEPNVITDGFIEAISGLSKLCDHFHLSLQSGSDRILKAMNRRYTTAEYERAVEKIRGIMPNAGITTDVIVGFPGENEDDFSESLEFVRKMGLSKIHVFPYSRKTGTKAAAMENQIAPHIKEERAACLGKLASELNKEFAEKFVNKSLSVLFERNAGGNIYEGHTTNYITFRGLSLAPCENQIIEVLARNAENGVLYGDF